MGLSMFVSCQKDPVDIYFEDKPVYFDMSGFIRGQIVNLKGRGFGLRKREEKDGFTRTIEKEKVDWESELAEFLECDINRPAWRDRFETDTVLRNESTLVIRHTAMVPECPMRSMVVTYDRSTGTCLKVSIEKQTDNFLYSSEQRLFFTTGEGYSVHSKLEVSLLFSSEYEVESRFIEI